MITQHVGGKAKTQTPISLIHPQKPSAQKLKALTAMNLGLTLHQALRMSYLISFSKQPS